MSEIKNALENLEKEWREVKEVYRNKEEETKSGLENLSAETKQKLEEANDKLADLEQKFSEIETRANTVQPSADIVMAKGMEEINDFLKKGMHGLSVNTEIKSLSPDSGPDGGFALMPQFRGQIIEKIQDMSPVRQVAEVVTLGSGNEYVMLRENADPAQNNVGPRTSITETSAGTYDQVSVYVHEQAAFPLVARQQIEDQGFNLVENLQSRLAREFAQDEGTQFISGTGVNEAKGILTDSSIERVLSGDADNFTMDDLINLQAALQVGYNGTWGFSRKTRGYIRQLKGAENYFWEASLAAGAPNTLLGDPYVIMEDLADNDETGNVYADGDEPIIYGDWREGYVIVDRLGFDIEIDRLTNKPFVGYYVRRRVGGDVKQPAALKILKTATS